MTIQNRLFAAVVLVITASPLYLRAQDKIPVKFGKVTPNDFKVTGAGLDSAADVVVVADYGFSEFQANPSGGFDLQFHRSKRLRILKRAGFEAATVVIPVYTQRSGTEEKVIGLKANTYNLEDGKVVETKLDSKSIFTDKINRHWSLEKFTFPALKEGAILEFSYTLESPFISNLQPWQFQGRYPCLWSEYEVDMPNFYKYATLAQGFLPFKVKKTESRMANFSVVDLQSAGGHQRFNYSDEVVTHRWVMVNIPAMKEEPYTTTVGNYESKIEFQLSGVQFVGGIYQDRLNSWTKICEELLKGDYFGADLNSGNGWMDDDLNNIMKGATGSLERAQRIFAYVRDNFTCTSHGNLELSGSLKTIYKNRSGNEADLNLLLTAMLIHANLKADPIILSTRQNGFTHEYYPLIDRYNYVICGLTIDSTRNFLDASEPCVAFGQLPERCYNGGCQVISNTESVRLDLSADAVTEGKVTLVAIANADKGGLDVHVQSKPGFSEAASIRQRIRESGQQEFLKKIQTGFSGDASVSGLELDSLKQPDLPLAIAYDVHLAPDSDADVYYFNPLLAEGYKGNPFKAAVRSYPVEMPYAMDETYILAMDIPNGYVVDEVPKSAKVSFNTDEGFFEYLVQKDEDKIQLRTRIKLKKANFKPEDYSTLRDFFAYVVKKQGEQIVFKKKK